MTEAQIGLLLMVAAPLFFGIIMGCYMHQGNEGRVAVAMAGTAFGFYTGTVMWAPEGIRWVGQLPFMTDSAALYATVMAIAAFLCCAIACGITVAWISLKEWAESTLLTK